MTATLEDLKSLERLIEGLTPEKRRELAEIPEIKERLSMWQPNPGPQTEAYYSKADCLLYGGQPGGGKAVSVQTKIPTPFGWSTMGELQVGDSVLDENGNVCKIIAKSEVFTEPCYKVLFSDGSEIIAGARHQWVTSTRRERSRVLRQTDAWREKRKDSRPAKGTKRLDLAKRNKENARTKDLPYEGIRTTQEIFETLRVGGKEQRANHSVKVCKPFNLDDADLIIEPYVLGAWLGDGTQSSGAITGIDEEVFQQVSNFYTITRYVNPKTRGVIGLQADLRKIGVFKNKHIPDVYKRGSLKQRLSLLQGLMDTDGFCDKRGQCEFSQVNKRLAYDVLELILSLGIKATIREGVAKLNRKITGPNYKIKFQTDLPVFRLSRKILRQKQDNFRGTHDVRYIVDCIPLGSNIPLQCIQVDSPNNMYLCGDAMIPTHNSQLILGLAFNEHQRSLIMRREYSGLDRLIEDALTIHGSRSGFKGTPQPSLNTGKGIINFRAAQYAGDEQKTMGQGRDLLALDEATQFTEDQVRFLMGWVRSEDPNQRCRTVLATNPPLAAEGLWVNRMFAPWLDDRYHNPATPGELRWVISDEEGKDVWVDGPDDEREVHGKLIRPTSRTYIPASTKDNPYYVDSDYERQLDALPEPYRSLLMGGFKTQFRDADNQVIPTAWVKAAQQRWKADGWKEYQMSAMAIDPAGGGPDSAILAWRHGGWYAKLVQLKGEDTRDGSAMASAVVARRRADVPVIVDMGGGYGTDVTSRLRENGITCQPFNGANKSTAIGKDQVRFVNARAEAWWKFRDELNPDQEGGSQIALPDDPEILADLTAPTFEVKTSGIQIESKEQIKKRLGRSPDKGDAVVMCLAPGNRAIKRQMNSWVSNKPKIQLGYSSAKRRTRKY